MKDREGVREEGENRAGGETDSATHIWCTVVGEQEVGFRIPGRKVGARLGPGAEAEATFLPVLVL